MTYRILLSGGGTAGSVTPLIALADQIRRQHPHSKFLFLGTADGPERVLAVAAKLPFETMTGAKLRRYWSWLNVRDLGRLWTAYRQARTIVKRWRPDVAVTAGSYVSVPVIWAAHRAGVRTLVHQQDVRPGLANRLMAPAADLITLAFKESAVGFSHRPVRWIGNPVRPEILTGTVDQARQIFNLPTGRPVLLILGGGTGSVAINALVAKLADRLVRHWTIIHVTGPQRDFVKLDSPHYQSFTFLTWQLPHAIAVAEVVISRAGLGAISELAALGKPAIFIPLPNSHQTDNAHVLKAAAAGIVLGQQDHIESRLVAALEQLRANPNVAERLGHNLRQFYNPTALPQMADEVLHLIGL